MSASETIKSEDTFAAKAVVAPLAGILGGDVAAPVTRRAEPFRRKAPFPLKKKVCRFCAENTHDIDYKQIQLLRTFMSETGKILSSRITGTCATHQRALSKMIKRARNLALLPCVVK
jgi:small subunit ribosomal protein S18